LDLPEKDGASVRNFYEHLQSVLITESLWPKLSELYGKDFCIGVGTGIYWRATKPPGDGCKAPDWFLVPGVPPLLEGTYRRSYVLWNEGVRPLLIIEYVNSDGVEERDRTPGKGKFWVYEHGIGTAFYAIFDSTKGSLELWENRGHAFHRVPPNSSGRLPIAPLDIELCLWRGPFQGLELTWLRIWDQANAQMFLTDAERAERERIRADEAETLLEEFRQALEDACEREKRILDKAQEFGIDPTELQ
jgi:Uma2 family endonuclease